MHAFPRTSESVTGRRSQWVDVAKGVCIVLVVLWHVIMKHYLQIDWRLPLPVPGLWGALGELLLPMRMPLFFTVSGMLAANAVRRPWNVVARSRVALFLYLYAVWLVIHTTVLWTTPGFDTLAARNALQFVEQLTITPTNLWYLLALAVYFVIAKTTRSLPATAVIVPALLLSAVASAGLLAAPGNRGQLYQNLLFFLLGLRFKEAVTRWASPRLFPILAAAYLTALFALRAFDAKEWFGVWPALSVLAVLAGVTGAMQLARVSRLSDPLAALGRTTLPIYVMHMPLLALMDAALRDTFSAVPGMVQLVLAVALPAALTVVLVAACLRLHGFVAGSSLFNLPAAR